MSAFAGSALYATWIHAGGTVILSGDFRALVENQSVEVIDATAGADSYREKLPYVKDNNVTMTMVSQSAGTVLLAALAVGTQGTLIYGEEGTAAGKPKHTHPSFVSQSSINVPFSAVVEISVTFEGSSAPTFGVYP